MLASRPDTEVNLPDEKGRTALMYAAMWCLGGGENGGGILQILANNTRVDVNVRDSPRRETALYKAAFVYDLGLVGHNVRILIDLYSFFLEDVCLRSASCFADPTPMPTWPTRPARRR